MGTCLSCCDNDPHARPSTEPPVKSPVTAPAHITTKQTVQQQQQQAAGDQAALDKKMFSPYTKLPPIKKTGGTDSKRASFTPGEVSLTRIQSLYERYKDSDEDCVLADGIERFCKDLEVKPDEFRVLLLAWKFEAETMCKFTHSEFVSGCKKLHADSVKTLQSRFPKMLAEVENKENFKDLYRWTYRFGLDTDQGQRTLPTDMALSLWQLVFSQSPPPILPRWLDFLRDHPQIRGIPKDTWDMFLNLTEVVGEDLSCYDDTEAWPSLFDDFVEFENDRQNQNVRSEKEEKDAY